MNRILSLCEKCVSTGVRAYIELLAYGELSRSRLLLNDVLTISTTISGGPSARVGPRSIGGADGSRAHSDSLRLSDRACLAVTESTARSLLATLLVLRTTAYWSRVPALQTLLDTATRIGTLASRSSSGCFPCAGTNGHYPDGAEPLSGCRRSRTLPGGPVVDGRSDLPAGRGADQEASARTRE